MDESEKKREVIMKKSIVFDFGFVMLLATVLTCGIDASAADVEKKPFYMANWDTVDSEVYPASTPKPICGSPRIPLH